MVAVRLEPTHTFLEMTEKLMARVDKLEKSRLPKRSSLLEYLMSVRNRE